MIIKTFWKPVCWAVLICILSIMPADDFNSQKWFTLPHQDKILHFIFYGIFSFLLLRSLLSYFNKSKPVWLLVLATFVIILIYGTIIEIIQDRFTASRQGDIMDIIFNLAGCLTGMILVFLLPFFRGSSKVKE
jgi:VanZ family protein